MSDLIDTRTPTAEAKLTRPPAAYKRPTVESNIQGSRSRWPALAVNHESYPEPMLRTMSSIYLAIGLTAGVIVLALGLWLLVDETMAAASVFLIWGAALIFSTLLVSNVLFAIAEMAEMARRIDERLDEIRRHLIRSKGGARSPASDANKSQVTRPRCVTPSKRSSRRRSGRPTTSPFRIRGPEVDVDSFRALRERLNEADMWTDAALWNTVSGVLPSDQIFLLAQKG